MILKLLALALCASYAAAEYVNSASCTNITSRSVDMRMQVSGCTSNDEVCSLIKGTNHDVKLYFTPSTDFKDEPMDFRVFGVFDKFNVPYGRKADACLNSTTTDDEQTCTVLEGFPANRNFLHKSRFRVSDRYPTMRLKVRFQIVSKRTKNTMMCLEVPVAIVEPSTTEAPPTTESNAV